MESIILTTDAWYQAFIVNTDIGLHKKVYMKGAHMYTWNGCVHWVNCLY